MHPEKEHTEAEKLDYPVAELLICMGEYQGCGSGCFPWIRIHNLKKIGSAYASLGQYKII